METFYLIVLSIAVMLLIIILTIVGLMMSSNKNTEVFPPTKNTCPDSWKSVKGGCQLIDGKNRGSFMINDNATPGYTQASDIPDPLDATKTVPAPIVIDFANTAWSGKGGKTAICATRDWANKNGIVWDGVANYNAC